jgi:hypothetical protein
MELMRMMMRKKLKKIRNKLSSISMIIRKSIKMKKQKIKKLKNQPEKIAFMKIIVKKE